jgi:integrase
VKGVKSAGTRTGNWLTQAQAQALLDAPDAATLKGARDQAILGVLLGCGLRRGELAALTFGHLQQRDGRWAIVDIVGKGNRVRTVPMPAWTRVLIDRWALLAGLADGRVFRALRRGDHLTDSQGMSPNAIADVVFAHARSRSRARRGRARAPVFRRPEAAGLHGWGERGERLYAPPHLLTGSQLLILINPCEPLIGKHQDMI